MMTLPLDPVDRLSEVSERLYGYGWRVSAADGLDVSRATIQRWLARTTPPPADLDARLLAAARARADDLRSRLSSVEHLIAVLEKSTSFTTKNPHSTP
jgi:hypothetical protein